MIDNIKRYNYKNKDDSGQCWLKFAQWYQRRFSKRFTMGKNRRQVMVKAHMPFGLSKLKKKSQQAMLNVMNNIVKQISQGHKIHVT